MGYPIAVDNDLAVWRGFDNQYWPALYLFDVKGNIRHRKFGEGGYEDTERAIQKLLAEAGRGEAGKNLVSVVPDGIEAQADWDDIGSPETYLGADRGENRVASPARLRLNQWALGGEWTVRGQPAVLGKANGRITYRFHARDLNLVMGPGPRGNRWASRCSWTAGHPAPRTASTWTRGATGPSPSPACPGVEVFVFTFG